MLTSNTTVRPVHKPRNQKPRELQPCPILYEKVLVASNGFVKETDRSQSDKEAKAILDRADGDTTANRLAMVRLLKDVRNWVADEATQAAKKAQALAEYNALIAPVGNGWKAANEAWVKYVQAEKAKGHNGQLALAREGNFFAEFVRFEALVANIKADPEAVSALVVELTDLTFAVQNFVWTKWCPTCGDPVEKFVPKNGECGNCFRSHSTDDSVAEVKPAKRRVAKPGSASKRHKGGAKKVKGKLSAKDEAKNAKLMAEAVGIAHQGKPNTKQPSRTVLAGKKVGTKTKKNKGIGS